MSNDNLITDEMIKKNRLLFESAQKIRAEIKAQIRKEIYGTRGSK